MTTQTSQTSGRYEVVGADRAGVTVRRGGEASRRLTWAALVAAAGQSDPELAAAYGDLLRVAAGQADRVVTVRVYNPTGTPHGYHVSAYDVTGRLIRSDLLGRTWNADAMAYHESRACAKEAAARLAARGYDVLIESA